MRNFKRVIAGVLAVAMLSVVIASSAFAATYSVKKGTEQKTKTGTYIAQKDTKQASYTSKGLKKSTTKVTIAKTVSYHG